MDWLEFLVIIIFIGAAFFLIYYYFRGAKGDIATVTSDGEPGG